MARRPEGIRPRHARTCAERSGGTCSCRPSWEASVFVAAEGRKVRRSFPTLSAAKAWRADAQGAARRGVLRGPSPVTVADAAAALLTGMESGKVRARGGATFKPSVVRSYRQALDLRVVPTLGGIRLERLTAREVQRLVDDLHASGLAASTIRNAIAPLRVIFRRAALDGTVSTNPTRGLELPSGERARDRIATPDEAARLIAALARADDRAVWSTAFYAGLRLGELRGLRWEDVDLGAGTIRVEQALDSATNAVISPKSRAGRRTVPMIAALREALLDHSLDRPRTGYVFGTTPGRPFTDTVLIRRARRAWAREGLDAYGFHEARHCFVSLMVAAGVDFKRISTWAGHGSITITLDRYAHLAAGSEADAVATIEAYLSRADSAGRRRQLDA